MKKRSIILWSVFAVSAICGATSALLSKTFESAAVFWFFIYIGFVSVKYLLLKTEKKEEIITKRRKIILWSVFAVTAICLGIVMVNFMLDKNFYAVTVYWVMISIGFVITKLALYKADNKENNSVPADL